LAGNLALNFGGNEYDTYFTFNDGISRLTFPALVISTIESRVCAYTIIDPTNLKPCCFKSLLIASDSSVFSGISFNERKAFLIGLPSMKRLMPELKGKADGKLINEVVRELLQ
jgi:hypothetical protein